MKVINRGENLFRSKLRKPLKCKKGQRFFETIGTFVTDNQTIMYSTSDKCHIRAEYDERTISVYQAFSPSIADPAMKAQKLVSPFSYDRMTWIKPSFLWLMYRSNWATSAGMERILKIRIQRKNWDAALEEAVLTTPELHVYPDAKKWRVLLDRSRVRVQWDPERDIMNNRMEYKSIQVGITKHLCEEYGKKWIVSIEDCTDLARKIRSLLDQGKIEGARKLLPEERLYPANDRIRSALGID